MTNKRVCILLIFMLAVNFAYSQFNAFDVVGSHDSTTLAINQDLHLQSLGSSPKVVFLPDTLLRSCLDIGLETHTIKIGTTVKSNLPRVSVELIDERLVKLVFKGNGDNGQTLHFINEELVKRESRCSQLRFEQARAMSNGSETCNGLFTSWSTIYYKDNAYYNAISSGNADMHCTCIGYPEISNWLEFALMNQLESIKEYVREN